MAEDLSTDPDRGEESEAGPLQDRQYGIVPAVGDVRDHERIRPRAGSLQEPRGAGLHHEPRLRLVHPAAFQEHGRNVISLGHKPETRALGPQLPHEIDEEIVGDVVEVERQGEQVAHREKRPERGVPAVTRLRRRLGPGGL